MTGAPITSPAVVLTTALHTALAPVAPLAPDGLRAFGWLVSRPGLDEALQAGTLSGLIIAQSQGPLRAAGWVGEGTAEGSIALRCLALTDDGAQTLLAAAISALGTGVTITGYRVQLAYAAELIIPPLGGRYTAACLYTAEIRRLTP